MRLVLCVLGAGVAASALSVRAESIGIGAATSDSSTVVAPLVRIEAAPSGGFEVFAADQLQPLLIQDHADAAQQGQVWPMPGDVTLKGQVDFSDLVMLARNYGKTNATWGDGDFNNDGSVGFDDLVPLARNFGHHASAPDVAAAVPLPMSLWGGVALLCGYGLIRRAALRAGTSV